MENSIRIDLLQLLFTIVYLIDFAGTSRYHWRCKNEFMGLLCEKDDSSPAIHLTSVFLGYTAEYTFKWLSLHYSYLSLFQDTWEYTYLIQLPCSVLHLISPDYTPRIQKAQWTRNQYIKYTVLGLTGSNYNSTIHASPTTL